MTHRADLDLAESRSVPRDAARQRRVDRIVGELRRGTPVVLRGGGRAVVVSAAETAAFGGLTRLRELTPAPVELVLTGRRAGGLGLDIAGDTVALSGHALARTDLLGLADPAAPVPALDTSDLGARPGGPLAQSALQATKLARLLPAALQAALDTADAAAWARQHDLLMVEAGDIAAYQDMVAGSLAEVAEARVPIAGAENTRLRAFRPADGGIEHLAIVIGEPRADEPVLVRLHSECFTGDLLGSLRCDCGDQLRGAIDTMAEAGAGVILYLAQEGRGIGLINKLRAYHLQDAGADTLDANEALGFEPDERIYAPAAAMLKAMGFTAVKLLTNNPDKVAALTRWGVTVESRVPHRFPSNQHSADYISTKATRFGHLY
jgi:GTP cyclohydrolase II